MYTLKNTILNPPAGTVQQITNSAFKALSLTQQAWYRRYPLSERIGNFFTWITGRAK